MNDASHRRLPGPAFPSAPVLHSVAIWVFLFFAVGRCAPADEAVVLPLIEDPSPVIDGDLSDWTARDRGALLAIDRPEQVTYGRGAWKGVEDLGGWARLGHDRRYLFVAAHVVDNVVSQERSGHDLWRGDHVILFLDFVRSGQWRRILQLGLSPGSLAPDGPGPEAVIWRPEGLSAEGIVVAARKTEDGYEIEAAIPWKTLGVEPVKYQTFAFDLAFSDCDRTPNVQETCMSFGTSPWNTRDPKRLLFAGLGDRAGFIPPEALAVKRIEIAKEEFIIEPRSQKGFVVEIDGIPDGLIPTLTFKARAVWPKVGGCIAGLYVDVNGKPVPMKSLVERPRAMEFVGGGSSPSWARGITLFYSTDFDAVEKSPYKPIGFRACDYVLRLDGLFHPGRNTITFKNNLHFSWAARDIRIAMADVALTWRTPSQFTPAKVWKPAPTGPLPTFEPSALRRVAYDARLLPGGAVQVEWGGRSLVVESRFSRPGGSWAVLKADEAKGWDTARSGKGGLRAVAGALELRRSIETHEECILVRDALTNTSGELLPVMISHEAETGEYESLYLCGRPIPSKRGANNVAENPTVVVFGENDDFGLMAYDDIFRVHCRSACDGESASIGDNSLVLRPGATYEHEWLIVPLERPDYWAFVNAVRRFLDVNFTIPGSFAFFPAPYRRYFDEPAEAIGKFIDYKAARFVGITTGYNYKGLFAHGPVKRECETDIHIETIRMLRKVRPQARLLVYFNCFDCARAKDDPVRWPECQVLRPDGRNIRDGSAYPVYFPTLENPYGSEMDLQVDWVLERVGADGVWWDMFNGYGTHYGEPWDGWSADIDSRTHEIIRKKSSTALITWPWREKTLGRFLDAGKTVIINGGPMTTTECRYRVPRVAETASIGNLSWVHLFTPIALGDHVTEKNEADCYAHMLKALDWGGLYYWYSSHVRPTRPTLTSHMFPFTPIELHGGYLIGEERILTNRSGLFGWGDDSDFEAHVFDRVGRETTEIAVRRVTKDGRAYAEVRLPEGYSAAIVRKAR